MRILSVWLPRWPILRLITAQARNSTSTPIAAEKPLVLVTEAPGGPRIAALNGMAESLGL
jgi:protein ImuB